MEIRFFTKGNSLKNRFKIDLIVWKLYYIKDNKLNNDLFKIDLIVWKWFKDKYFNVQITQFKIDLIVWKCVTCF